MHLAGLSMTWQVSVAYSWRMRSKTPPRPPVTMGILWVIERGESFSTLKLAGSKPGPDSLGLLRCLPQGREPARYATVASPCLSFRKNGKSGPRQFRDLRVELLPMPTTFQTEGLPTAVAALQGATRHLQPRCVSSRPYRRETWRMPSPTWRSRDGGNVSRAPQVAPGREREA